MYWEELYIDKLLNSNEIKTGLKLILPVFDEEILLISNIEELGKINENIKILCETSVVKTDFPLKLNVFVRDVNLKTNNDLYSIGKFCESLNCKVLISNNSINPFTMIRVEGVSDIYNVTIDPDQYDSAEPFEPE